MPPRPARSPARRRPPPAAAPAGPPNLAAFVPSSRFLGARAGCVFKHGTQGLGYYRDIQPVDAAESSDAVEARARDDDLMCPICLDVLTYPVSLVCGHNVCRPCLIEHLEVSRASTACPSACPSVPHRVPAVNLALQAAIARGYAAGRAEERRAELPSPAEQERRRAKLASRDLPSELDLAAHDEQLELIRAEIAGFRRDVLPFLERVLTWGRGALLVLLLLPMVALLARLSRLDSVAVPRAPPKPHVASLAAWGANDTAHWLEWTALSPYADAARARNVTGRVLGGPLGTTLAALGAPEGPASPDRRELVHLIAASGIRPVSAWDGGDVAVWLGAYLPPHANYAALAREQLHGRSIALFEHDASAATRALTSLGLSDVHALEVARQADALHAASRTLYDFLMSDVRHAFWLRSHAYCAPRLTLIELRYGEGNQELRRALPLLVRRVESASFVQFWPSLVFFPFERSIEQLRAHPAEIGAPFAAWLTDWAWHTMHAALLCSWLAAAREGHRRLLHCLVSWSLHELYTLGWAWFGYHVGWWSLFFIPNSVWHLLFRLLLAALPAADLGYHVFKLLKLLATMSGVDSLFALAIWASSVAASFDLVAASPPALSAAVFCYTAAMQTGLVR